MKHTLAIATCLTALMSLTQNAAAVPTTIVDNYVGADDNGHGDVIGNTNHFQIRSLTAEVIGTNLSVSINTTFAGKGDNGLFASHTYDGMGIGYGDLFLSSSWNPYGTAPYYSDDAGNGTIWDYGFSLSDRYMADDGDGSGTLYSLNSGDNSDILLSDSFIKNSATYRNGQEVAVDTQNGDITEIDTNVNEWSVDQAGQTVNFLIDISNTDLLLGDEIAIRWEMTCSNDAIEGDFMVGASEPTLLPLLSAGLFAILGLRRRRH